MTLAQIFWLSGSGQPERMHVVADRELTIARDFSDFGHDIKNLRKRLRDAPDIEVHDTFPPYGAAFRRRFGIEGEQALELFSQTVSMKSVGNLTDFVRSHMLEPEPVDERIDALIHHFDDLSRAHDAVVRARAQIEALGPLVADAREHQRLSDEAASWRTAREALEPWFAGIEAQLLEERRQRLDDRIRRYDERIRRLDDDLTGQRSQREELQRAIAEQGGDRLEALAQQIGEHQREAERRRRNADAYNALAEHLGLSRADEADAFLANQERLAGLREEAEARLSERQNERTELEVGFRELRSRHQELEQELLKERDERSRLADRSERTAKALATARERHQAATEAQRSEAFPLLDGIREEALAEQALTVESLANAQSAVRNWVSRHIDNVERNLRRLADKVVSAMADFRHQWPLEAQEMDTRVEAYGEYAALLDALKSDDLPRFERRFRPGARRGVAAAARRLRLVPRPPAPRDLPAPARHPRRGHQVHRVPAPAARRAARPRAARRGGGYPLHRRPGLRGPLRPPAGADPGAAAASRPGAGHPRADGPRRARRGARPAGPGGR